SPLTLSNAQISGDFAQNHNCPNPLNTLDTCVFSVTFSPASTGTRQGSLTITSSASATPLVVALTGTGTAPDFPLPPPSSSPSSATVTAGQTANYSLSLVSGANSSGPVTLTCAQVPTNAHCAINPASVTLTPGGNATVSVSVTTGGSTSASLPVPITFL